MENRVYVIAPSYPGKKENLDRIREWLKNKLQLDYYLPPDIYNDKYLPYSNSTEFRSNELIKALKSDCKIIWAIRGGFGAERTFYGIKNYFDNHPDEKEQVKAKSKIIIGYSDITALHLFCSKEFNMEGLHAPMLEQIVTKQVSQEICDKICDIQHGKISSLDFSDLKLVTNSVQPPESLTAEIVGGNSYLIQINIGTHWNIDVTNKILFLEAGGCDAYEIVGRLTQFAYVFHPKAFILGDFTGNEEEHEKERVEQARREFAEDCSRQNIPVFSISGIGHGKTNQPLPLYCPATIRLSNDKEGFYSMTVQCPKAFLRPSLTSSTLSAPSMI